MSIMGYIVLIPVFGVGIALFLPKKLDRTMLSDKGWVGQGIMDAAGIIINRCRRRFRQGAAEFRHRQGGRRRARHLEPRHPAAVSDRRRHQDGARFFHGAIITTTGLMAPLLPALGLDSATATALTVVAIGAGAMVVSHANDSFFWVVTQFSNMPPEIGYRLHTVGTLVQGVVAIATLWVIAATVL